MKQGYIYLLSAMMAVSSATAASATDIVARRNVNNVNPGTLLTWEEVSKNLQGKRITVAPTESLRKMAPAAAKTHAVAKAQATPASIDELVATKWDASYAGMLNNNSGTHEGAAEFTYYDQYEELDLTLPDYNTDLYVGYENGSLIIYNKVNYGSNANGDIVLCPIDPTSGALKTDNNIEIKFNETTGAFEFPKTFAWGLCAVKNNALAGYYWAASDFTLSVSQGDFSINSEIEDECTPDNKFKYSVNPGADAASVKVLVLPYDGDAAEHASYVAALGTTIKAGEIYTVDPVNENALISQSGPMSESGHASLIFASYDTDGNLKRTESHSLIVVLESEKGWRNICEMTYTDQLFAQLYKNFSHSQQAILQEKEDQSGLYRLVDPYSERNVHKTDCHHYFIIDATDKNWVDIPFSVSGINVGGDGILTFGTSRALGYDKESAAAEGLTAGKQNGQTITFPAKSIFCHEQYYDKAGIWSYFNASSPVTIALPDITLDITVVDTDNKPVEGAIITTDVNDHAYNTDAEGKATIDIPFEKGYFGKISATVNIPESKFSDTKEIDLNGAKTACTYVADLSNSIHDIILGTETPAIYYNLQGIRVDNPRSGIYIRRQGNKTTKVHF